MVESCEEEEDTWYASPGKGGGFVVFVRTKRHSVLDGR